MLGLAVWVDVDSLGRVHGRVRGEMTAYLLEEGGHGEVSWEGENGGNQKMKMKIAGAKTVRQSTTYYCLT